MTLATGTIERHGTQGLGDAGDQGTRLPHQPKAEIVRRHADGTAAGPGVADEIGDIGAVLAFDDADAAIGLARHHLTGLVEAVAGEAGRRPFPDIAGEIGDAILVDAEASEGARLVVDDLFGFALIACDPPL